MDRPSKQLPARILIFSGIDLLVENNSTNSERNVLSSRNNILTWEELICAIFFC